LGRGRLSTNDDLIERILWHVEGKETEMGAADV
jgi:hypothetical protein